MGTKIELKNGYIHARTKELKGAQINFDLVSVTATENIVMAATLANGITTISNAAQEPEVTDLINCLNKMGAKITGENS
jgi:UDP-N-acetylglucosamine 1-carboxyvinyltransferase